VSISLVLSAWPWLLVKSIPRLQRSLGPWIIGSRASRHQGFWIPFFLDTLSPSLPGLLVSWCLVSSASRFLYAKFSMSKVAAIPIFQVSERPEAHRHQPGTAALVPWSHDTPFPRFVIPLFSGFQVSESSSSQVPESRWITNCRNPPWKQGPHVPSFLGFWSTTVCRNLADRGLSAIKAPGTACSFNSLGFEASRQQACHDGSSNLDPQATRFQGLKLTDPTSWPDRHGPWSAWSQVVKRVQFA